MKVLKKLKDKVLFKTRYVLRTNCSCSHGFTCLACKARDIKAGKRAA